MSEAISDNVPNGTYQLFYVYLYLGSLLFLTSVYIDVLRTKAGHRFENKRIKLKKDSKANDGLGAEGVNGGVDDETTGESGKSQNSIKQTIPPSLGKLPKPTASYGSFYLRVGCVSKYKVIFFFGLKT